MNQTTWLRDAGLGLVVLVLGVASSGIGVGDPDSLWLPRVLLMLIVCAGVALHHQAPGFALLLMWAAVGMHVVAGVPIMLIEAAAAVVAFGTARYGSAAVVWLSGFSLPIGPLILVYVASGMRLVSSMLSVRSLPDSRLFSAWAAAAFLAWMFLLVVPWMAGLVLRSRAATLRSQTGQAIAEEERAAAEAARDQASEIARLREQQARLANDVHDVVGHSLTVILAQAESAQFLPADDPDRIRQTLDNIAASARQSLGDVRQVLSSTSGSLQAGPAASLDSLIDGVRAAGYDVRSTVAGTPQPLAPELDAVAFRVLQEMLTNALKHGRRGQPLYVERHWQGDLRIEVTNVMPFGEPAHPAGAPGPYRPPPAEPLGLEGMRRRLESAGGRLDVRHRGQAGEATFTVTAWIPFRPVGHA